MKAVVIGVKENKAAVLMQDGSMRYVENRGYEKGTLLELPDTDNAVTGFEVIKKNKVFHFPQRFIYSAAASLAVLMLSGAMVSFACPASTIPLSSDPEVTLGVNIYGRVIEINAGNEKNEELLKEIKREMKGRPVPEVSQAIELKFDEHRMEIKDDQGAQAPAPENPGSRDMEDPGSQNAEPPAPEIQQDQTNQGSEGDLDMEPPAPEKPESSGDQSLKNPESTRDQRPDNPENTGTQKPENPENTGAQKPENPESPVVNDPAPEKPGGRNMDNPGSQDTEPPTPKNGDPKDTLVTGLPAPVVQQDQTNQGVETSQGVELPAPEIRQDQPNQNGEDALDMEPPVPEIQQDQPGKDVQDTLDMEPPAPPEDRESPPETESGGQSEKPDDDPNDGPKGDHAPDNHGNSDHGDVGHGGPGGGP